MTTAEPDRITNSILIVDSEVISRHVIADYLRQCGYSVVEGATIEEAYVAVSEQSLSIDIILLAVVGSETKTAFEFVQWARSNRPELQVSLAGGVDMAAQTAANLCKNGPYLKRPYEPEMIVDRIRRIRAGLPLLIEETDLSFSYPISAPMPLMPSSTNSLLTAAKSLMSCPIHGRGNDDARLQRHWRSTKATPHKHWCQSFAPTSLLYVAVHSSTQVLTTEGTNRGRKRPDDNKLYPVKKDMYWSISPKFEADYSDTGSDI